MSTAGLLVAGQRLLRETFHERYKKTPPDFRAELIDGVVHVRGRVGFRHADANASLVCWLGLYKIRTPGVEAGSHASTALDDLGEVHPDVLMRIAPDRGGQTLDVDDIIGGAPELVVEVAEDSKAVDLGPKLDDYERAGTLEYIVLAIDPDEVYWHARRGGRLVRVPPDPDGLYRSRTFPGLWLDPAALLADDGPALVATLERGLATAEHAAFVAHLAAAGPRGG